MLVKKLERHGAHNLLGIDVGRRNERGGCGLNEGIFQCKYAEMVVRSQEAVMIDTEIKIR